MFKVRAQGGGLSFSSDFSRDRFRKFLKENEGIILTIKPELPESKNQRAFYHGAVLPLWAYLDGKDYKDSDVMNQMHEVAKREFNGEIIMINHKPEKVGKSSKGLLNDGYLERIITYLAENYAIDPVVVLNPELYKTFRDTIYPFDTKYEDFIDYMQDLNLLPTVHN